MRWPKRVAMDAGVLALFGFTLTPFWVMLSTSLQGQADVLRAGPASWPAHPAWQNYPGALTALPFGTFFLNTIVFSGAVVIGQLVTSVLAGYAFARMAFAGRRRVFALLLGVMCVPAIVLLIPRFLLLQALGWVDTLGGLISAELVSVWGIFLMRQAFQQLPAELEEAARLDGAGTWTIFREVALPAVKPALVTLALFAFLDSWRAYLWPLVATRSLELRTIEVGAATFHGLYYSNWPYQMVAAVAAALPLLLVFVVAQRYFVRGIQLMGFK
ncbi:MAG: carbohydrate ABC transporter permease [Gemmatimonadales bacterium]